MSHANSGEKRIFKCTECPREPKQNVFPFLTFLVRGSGNLKQTDSGGFGSSQSLVSLFTVHFHKKPSAIKLSREKSHEWFGKVPQSPLAYQLACYCEWKLAGWKWKMEFFSSKKDRVWSWGVIWTTLSICLIQQLLLAVENNWKRSKFRLRYFARRMRFSRPRITSLSHNSPREKQGIEAFDSK